MISPTVWLLIALGGLGSREYAAWTTIARVPDRQECERVRKVLLDFKGTSVSQPLVCVEVRK